MSFMVAWQLEHRAGFHELDGNLCKQLERLWHSRGGCLVLALKVAKQAHFGCKKVFRQIWTPKQTKNDVWALQASDAKTHLHS